MFQFLFGIHSVVWLDTFTAFIVGIIICKTAWDIFGEAALSLTDGFDVDDLEEIKSIVAGTPGVLSLSDIKGRYHGSITLLDVIIEVDPTISVLDGDRIADLIEERLEKEKDIHYVHIHVEPHLKQTSEVMS